MAMKDDVADFLFHLAIKWNIHKLNFPSTCRQTFFRREAMNLQWLAKKEVKTIVRAMLDYPDKADWIFDQHFQILTNGLQPCPFAHPISEQVQSQFDQGYEKIRQQFE